MWFLADNAYKGQINASSIGLPTSTPTIDAGFSAVLNILFALVGGLAIIFIIVGGLQMSLSMGNAAQFARGRKTVLFSVVGIVIAMAALAIVTFVTGAFSGTASK